MRRRLGREIPVQWSGGQYRSWPRLHGNQCSVFYLIPFGLVHSTLIFFPQVGCFSAIASTTRHQIKSDIGCDAVFVLLICAAKIPHACILVACGGIWYMSADRPRPLWSSVAGLGTCKTEKGMCTEYKVHEQFKANFRSNEILSQLLTWNIAIEDVHQLNLHTAEPYRWRRKQWWKQWWRDWWRRDRFRRWRGGLHIFSADSFTYNPARWSHKACLKMTHLNLGKAWPAISVRNP